jgi:spore maturation protein SpmA
MMMNFSANMLGLDNAATPLGLTAMKQLQELNPEKEKASNAQIMFLVLNTSGLTIIPVSVFRGMLAANERSLTLPAFSLPILIATFFASFFGSDHRSDSTTADQLV